jgi:hypothetical protein
MTAELSRRQFVAVGAAAVAGLRVAGGGHAEQIGGAARYVHVELGAGPWPRREVARIAERAATRAGLDSPTRITALGTAAGAAMFPEEFAITLEYPAGARMAIRASRRHAGGPEVVVRPRSRWDRAG